MRLALPQGQATNMQLKVSAAWAKEAIHQVAKVTPPSAAPTCDIQVMNKKPVLPTPSG